MIKKLRIMTVFGTRPEAIKMAPVIKELKKHNSIETIVTVTGQHREMLDQVLSIFQIQPDYDLNIIEPRQSLTTITLKALEGLIKIIDISKPELILVHGDTTTTFSAALAGIYSKIPIGHVEAGLRTFNKFSPYPEEINRQLTKVLADLHFAPTKEARRNLLKENTPTESIFVTGNTVIDALKYTVVPNYTHPLLKTIQAEKIILLTTHRRENLGAPMEHIFKAVKRLAGNFPNLHIVYPVHLNPIIGQLAQKVLGNHPRIHLIRPLGVLDFHNFMAKSHLILTDSGGIQEEAPSLGKPVLVLRDTSERPEGIQTGTLKLVGTNEEAIFNLTKELLESQEAYNLMAKAVNPYGDGMASERIVGIILHYFGYTNQLPLPFEI